MFATHTEAKTHTETDVFPIHPIYARTLYKSTITRNPTYACYFSVCFQQLQKTEVTTNHGQLMQNALQQSLLKTPDVALQVY